MTRVTNCKMIMMLIAVIVIKVMAITSSEIDCTADLS